MVRQGWLEPYRDTRGPGYRITAVARRRLDEAAKRIYGRTNADDWDGSWSLVVVERTTDRSRRDRLQRGLEYLGYRLLDGTT
jgi:phenylacetic acid degradation operon negative regulatory protein